MARKTQPIEPPPAVAELIDLSELPAVLAGDADRAREVTVWLNALVARADRGDREALRQATRVYDALPGLWQRFTGLHENLERSLLDMLFPPDAGQLFGRAVTERQLAALRTDLLGPTPTPLERLLADRIVVCWMEVTSADTRFAQRLAGGLSAQESEVLQRHAERAQRRYLAAIKALATVRRLLVPTVQLNVAEQQIVVGG